VGAEVMKATKGAVGAEVTNTMKSTRSRNLIIQDEDLSGSGTHRLPKFQKSPSDPGGLKPRVRLHPDAWQKGWCSNPTGWAGPRCTVGKEAFQKNVNRKYNSHLTAGFKELQPYAERKPAFRDTWIQEHMRQTQWTPGPGKYKSEREFLISKKDEVDTNKTIQEEAPEWSFGKDLKETSIQHWGTKGKKHNDAYKLMKNHGAYPKMTPFFQSRARHLHAVHGFWRCFWRQAGAILWRLPDEHMEDLGPSQNRSVM